MIERFATPDRRGIKLPEGNVSSMRIQKNPDSVLITDIDSIPLMFKQIVLTMRGYVWEAMLKGIGFEDRKGFEARVVKREFRPKQEAWLRMRIVHLMVRGIERVVRHRLPYGKDCRGHSTSSILLSRWRSHASLERCTSHEPGKLRSSKHATTVMV